MRKTNIARRGAALALAVLCVLPALSSCGERLFTVPVVAVGTDGAEVEGDALREIPYGADAVYTVTLPDDMEIVQVLKDGVPTSHYTFDGSTLTVACIDAPTTIRIVPGDPETQAFFGVESNTKYGGTIRTSIEQGRVKKGSLVTMTAAPRDGSVFIGWTLGKTIAAGGEILSKDEQITVRIEKTQFYYANYDDSGVEKPAPKISNTPTIPSKYLKMIYYNANGGVMKNGASALETTFDTSYWEMLVAREDDGTFTREGYVLAGYSYSADGSTGVYPPGHRFKILNDDKRLTLYCIWQKAADEASFTVSPVGNGNYVSIDGYAGTDDVLYIPRTIGGKVVTAIADGAFVGAGFSEVVVPPTVGTIGYRAFADCRSLTKVTLYDGLSNLTDEAFSGSPVKTLRLCASTLPRYQSGQSFSKKYERLVLAEGKKRVVVVSGSSKFFGLDTPYLTELLDDRYFVVNYGTNANMSILFFLEAVSSLVGEDDILVYAPEQYGPSAYCTNGNPDFPYVTYQGIEGSYNLMELIDVTRYTNVFTAFGQYCKTRLKSGGGSWNDHKNNSDEYGDCSQARKSLNSPSYNAKSNGVFRFNETVIPEEFRPNMNRVLDKANAAGATVLFSYPPVNRNNVEADSLNDEHYDAYNEFIRDLVHATLISDVRDHIYDAIYFFNTDYHLNEPGMALHTEALAKDLRAALGMDK